MNKKIRLGLLLISLFALSNPTYALSFGTHVKNSEINLNGGESGDFKILFFSRDSEPIEFLLTLKEHPDEFTITYPERFDLNKNSLDEQYILIENEYVKTKTIIINVGVPVDADLGEYRILLTSSTINKNIPSNSLGANLEKTFLLKVNVLGKPPEDKQETESKVALESEKNEEKEESTVNVKESKEENIESNEETFVNVKEREKIIETKEEVSPTGMITFVSNKTVFWIICMVSIIFFSYLIYKGVFRSKK